MDADELKAAGERLRAAISGKTAGPQRQYAEVRAADVVAVGGLVAAEKHTDVTWSLVGGAAAANPRNDPDLAVYQYADQVKKLLDLAGVP